jgi:formiminotetrahydrofolate cyclodeaminase
MTGSPEACSKMNFSKNTLSQFLEKLGSSSMTPGGGAAAAVTGALGAALVEMVIAINDKRAGVVSSEEKKSIRALRLRLLMLATLDARAFDRLSKHFKQPKESPIFQKAAKEASGTPLEICELCSKAMKIAAGQKNRTSRWLASDLREAQVLLRAAFDSGRLNVEINLQSLTDRKWARKTGRFLDHLETLFKS